MSEIMYKKKLAMFRTANSLVAHVGNRDSKMNPELRKSEQLLTLHFEDGEGRLHELMADPPIVHAAMASRW